MNLLKLHVHFCTNTNLNVDEIAIYKPYKEGFDFIERTRYTIYPIPDKIKFGAQKQIISSESTADEQEIKAMLTNLMQENGKCSGVEIFYDDNNDTMYDILVEFPTFNNDFCKEKFSGNFIIVSEELEQTLYNNLTKLKTWILL